MGAAVCISVLALATAAAHVATGATETICPDAPGAWTKRTFVGGITSGTALDTCDSDDVRLTQLNYIPVAAPLPYAEFDIWAHTSFAPGDVTSLQYIMEGGVNAIVPGGQNPETLRTSIRRYANGAPYELVDARITDDPFQDEIVVHEQTENVADYILVGDNEIRIRVQAFKPGSVLNGAWELRIDLFNVVVRD
jgi:hypothetical protein